MSLHHVTSGEVFTFHPLKETLEETISHALFKSSSLEVIRMVLRQGRSVPEHHVGGELTMQCLEGAVQLTAHGRTQTLHAGEMLYLEGSVPYSLQAVENCSLLLTIVLKRDD
ncbi:cupin domain-containing protein [Noviherbaspirillum massiliense]|uniref:cupin domain-containing protein n=1 Tax=Noviherbaspirillum massiliense TaxID=1465823 RepID=UPI0002D9D2D9|nr:cupin domain-containing protein [Noviherbaspirillum massiliense]